MNHKKHLYKRSQTTAFTLIEISIVLIVIGIIIGSSTKVFTSMAKNAKIKETKDQLSVMRQDLEGFSLVHHRLPSQEEFKNFRIKNSDSWGKKIIYLPADKLLKNICSIKTNLKQKHNKKLSENLAFILLSSGANRNLQSEIKPQSVKTVDYGYKIDLSPEVVNRVEAYDDLYLSQTLWSLYAQNSCKNGVKK